VSLKEFEADAKRRGLDGKTKVADAHELTVRRLEHELILRRELMEEKRKLEEEAAELRLEIENKRKLTGAGAVNDSLNELRRVAEPLRRRFDLPYASTQRLEERVELLPVPLYVLYAQLKHVQQGGDIDDVTCEVIGRLDEAQAVKKRIENEEEGDVKEDEASHSRRHGGHKRRGAHVRQRTGPIASSLYDEHPLSVQLGVGGVDVVFKYLLRLHVVVAYAKDSTGTVKENFLNDVFPDDDGSKMPNYASSTVQTDFIFDSSCVQSHAKPYAWAQNLAGLNFIPLVPTALGAADAKKITEKARAMDVVQALLAKTRRRS
jgi:THO complex subunit 5